MATIAGRAELAWMRGELPSSGELRRVADLDGAVGQATAMIASSVSARAIVAATTSGTTVRRVACHRPKMPVIALCSSPETCRRMSLLWGVEPVLVPAISGTAQLVKLSAEAAVKVLQAQPSDVVTIVAGTPYNVSGKTNLIKIEVVEDALKGEAKTFGE